jgi:hypothetical protein
MAERKTGREQRHKECKQQMRQTRRLCDFNKEGRDIIDENKRQQKDRSIRYIKKEEKTLERKETKTNKER